MNIEIRDLQETDFLEFKSIVVNIHKLHISYRPDIYVDSDPLPYEDFINILNDENTLKLVAIYNEKIVGVIWGEIKETNNLPTIRRRKFVLVDAIGVDQNYRGKGIGKKLYYALEEKAKRKNISSVELVVWSFNTDAIKFYESIGMKVKNWRYEKKI